MDAYSRDIAQLQAQLNEAQSKVTRLRAQSEEAVTDLREREERYQKKQAECDNLAGEQRERWIELYPKLGCC